MLSSGERWWNEYPVSTEDLNICNELLGNCGKRLKMESIEITLIYKDSFRLWTQFIKELRISLIALVESHLHCYKDAASCIMLLWHSSSRLLRTLSGDILGKVVAVILNSQRFTVWWPSAISACILSGHSFHEVFSSSFFFFFLFQNSEIISGTSSLKPKLVKFSLIFRESFCSSHKEPPVFLKTENLKVSFGAEFMCLCLFQLILATPHM